jgi:hypothetical protein
LKADDHPYLRVAVEVVVVLLGALLILWALQADRRWFEVHTTPHYCFDEPAQPGRARIVRWIAAACGLALILVVRPRAGRWAVRRSGGEVAGFVASVLAATLLALWVSDWRLRRKPAPPRVLLNYEPDSEGDPQYVYRPIRSHATEHSILGRVVNFAIDENGFRVRSPEDHVDFDRPSILFTGESVTSGFALPYEETYAAMIGKDLGVQSVNMGVQGYGNDQAYMLLHDALPRFAHPLATVTLVLNIEIERNTWLDRPHFVVRDDGTWTFEERSDKGWVGTSPLRALFERFYHSDEALRRARATIRATARDSQARGAFPLFVLTNSGGMCLPDDTGSPSIERILFDGLDVVHVRVDNADVWVPAIEHPDVRGHRRLAAAIEGALREHGVVEAAAAP